MNFHFERVTDTKLIESFILISPAKRFPDKDNASGSYCRLIFILITDVKMINEWNLQAMLRARIYWMLSPGICHQDKVLPDVCFYYFRYYFSSYEIKRLKPNVFVVDIFMSCFFLFFENCLVYI